MADVELVVETTSNGVQSAIEQIRQLRKESGGARTNLLQLAAASREMSNEIRATSAAAREGGDRVTGYGKAINATGKEATSLTQQLRTLNAEYNRTSKLSPGATARERLALAGNGNLDDGKAIARQAILLREALNPDLVRDYNTVLREEAALSDARSGRLSAQAALERQRWEAGLTGMKASERQLALVKRAEQELLVAQKALERSFIQTRDAAGNWMPYTTAQYHAQTQAVRGLMQAENALANARRGDDGGNAFQSSYSYFILAGLATQASQAIIGVGAASLTASMQIERSFADVDRTFDGTSAQLRGLRERLFELSTSTPLSFIDNAQIAALGNQLGVAAADIENFTITLSQYSTISGESAESAATAFGRISNLTGLAASQYSNLASAITYVARTSVATESTIQNTAKEISALASGAGFSAQSIVGLAGALSSLAIPPERARGALSLYFGALNGAVAEGGPKLAAFAELTNMTAENLNRLVRENRGQEVFQAFIQGLSELDTVAKTTALDTLGLSTIRVDQTMRALAQNVPLVTSAFEGANAAFEQNTELSRQYGIIQDTLDSKWREFQNAVQNAAGALGDSFAPAAKNALEAATDLLVMLTKFAETPIGRALIGLVGTIAGVIAALAALIGVASLAKASMVVLAFAVKQLGWSSATKGILGWVAALVSADKATRAAALSSVGFGVAMRESAVGTAIANRSLAGFVTTAKAAAVALSGFLIAAVAVIAITAAISDLYRQANRAQFAIDDLGDDVEHLTDAMMVDNPALVQNVSTLGDAAGAAGTGVVGLNDAVLNAAQAQIEAEGNVDKTTAALSRQELAIGDATRAWLDAAVLQSDALQDVLKGEKSGVPIIGGLFDKRAMSQELRAALGAGLDLSGISEVAFTQGTDAALAVYDGWIAGLQEKADAGDKAAKAAIEAMGGVDFRNVLIQPLSEGIDAAATEAIVAMQATGEAVTAVAADFDSSGNYVGEFAGDVGELFVVFSGVTDRIEDFRSAVQGALQGFVGFDAVLERAEATAGALAEKLGVDPKAVDAAGFGQALQDSITEATSFYDQITKLADGGSTSFALQLAELGPEASGILASALELDASGRQTLEANARFAAFLASDAFKDQLQADMQDANEGFARMLQGGASLADIQELIRAQVSDPALAEQIEREWAVNHPDLTLDITPDLSDPTEEEVAVWEAQMSGRLTVTPNIVIPDNLSPLGPNAGSNATTTYTDTRSGKSIVLPASLDGPALSASLAYWLDHQNQTPEQIASVLNTEGFDSDIDAWKATNGPISVTAKITSVVLGRDFGLPGQLKIGANYRDGGPIGKYATGGYIRGPGTPRSDSIPLWASRGEYMMDADATKFWGRDFMDSIERKMLPSSFRSMLGAASGNNGPTHVANVNVHQYNPLTRDPLKQLREDSENLASGIWGGS